MEKMDKMVMQYIDKCVLCWLATSNSANEPNVSPKEIFTHEGERTLLIANIASLGSSRNIRENPKVCVSFVDVFVQKGFKIHGSARLIKRGDSGFDRKVNLLKSLLTTDFPIKSVIEVTVHRIEMIKAPSYLLFPHITEQDQIESAYLAYGVKAIDYFS